MILHVAFTPGGVLDPELKVCLVIDVLRATSTLVTMIEAGCADIQLEPTVEAARLADSSRLRCGEEAGLRPADFDFGNSPAEYAGRDLRGRSIVFATTNGTKALQLARRSPLVLAASLRNGPAVAAYALAEAARLGLDIQVACSGRLGGAGIALDDSYTAGYLVDQLARLGGFSGGAGTPLGPNAGTASVDPDERQMYDSALVAQRLYRSYIVEWPTEIDAARAALRDSASGRTIDAIGLAADIEFCAQVGVTDVLPRAVSEHTPAGDRVRVTRATIETRQHHCRPSTTGRQPVASPPQGAD